MVNIEQNLKKKKKENNIYSSSHAVLMGLDKITAKSSEIIINLKETKNLSIRNKNIEMWKVKINNKIDDKSRKSKT